MSDTFSSEQRSRIAAFCDSGNPADLAGEDHGSFGQTGASENGVVSPTQCREWREAVRAGDSPPELAGPWANGTIRAHAYGRCNHPEHAVGPPAESPGPGGYH